MLSFFEFLCEVRAGKTTAAESAQITGLRAQHAKLKEKHPNGVPMDFGDGEVHHVTSIAKVKGYPKADVVFHTSDPKVKKYVSLKNSADPAKHRQFSGVSRSSDMKNNPIVQKFVKHLSKTEYTSESPKHSYSLDRSDPDHERLLHQAIFGKDYGGERGPNNVDTVHKGNVRIEKHPTKRGVYSLTADSVYKNGKLPKHVKGELVRENSKKQKDLGVPNSRIYVAGSGHNKTEDVTGKVK